MITLIVYIGVKLVLRVFHVATIRFRPRIDYAIQWLLY